MKIDGSMSVNGMDLASMDIETAMMAVQSQRTQLLDTQLANQIKAVQSRNDQIAKLNDALAKLTGMEQYYDSSGTSGFKGDGTAWGGNTGRNYDDFVKQVEGPLNTSLKNAGIDDLGWGNSTGQMSRGDFKTGPAVWGGGLKHGDITAAITKVKGLIDAQSNSQQMDMLRLQSLSNKRNEAFDVMTNFVKKMQDSRSSIIGNMR